MKLCSSRRSETEPCPAQFTGRPLLLLSLLLSSFYGFLAFRIALFSPPSLLLHPPSFSFSLPSHHPYCHPPTPRRVLALLFIYSEGFTLLPCHPN